MARPLPRFRPPAEPADSTQSSFSLQDSRREPECQGNRGYSSAFGNRRGYNRQRGRGYGGRRRGGNGRSRRPNWRGRSEGLQREPNPAPWNSSVATGPVLVGDIRYSLLLFHQQQRAAAADHGFIKCLSDEEVKEELRSFLMTQKLQPSDLLCLTKTDFWAMGMPKDTVDKLPVAESNERESEVVRALSGRVALQLEKWCRYVSALEEVVLEDFLPTDGDASGTVPAHGTSDSVDQIMKHLDSIRAAASEIVQDCCNKQSVMFMGDRERKLVPKSSMAGSIALKLGCVTAAALGLFCLFLEKVWNQSR